jgi:hypothetical protein
MPLLEDNFLFANLTLSIKWKEEDKAKFVKVPPEAPQIGIEFKDAIISGGKLPTATVSQITNVNVDVLRETKTGWRFFVTFTMPSNPQVRLKLLEMLRTTVDGRAFPDIDILNGTLSYNDDDGVFISRRVEEGTREHGALFAKPFKGLKVGDFRQMN